MRYIRQNRVASSAARARDLGLTAPPHEPERGLTGPPHELDLIRNLTRKQGKEPMEPPMEVTDLTCKKAQKSMQTGKQPMEPLSEVHRTSIDFDTQASKETGKGPMEPPMEMTDLACKKLQKSM